MAIFDSMKGALSDTLNLNKVKSVVGIDIGSSFIKVVQLRKEGEKAVLETYGELALGPYMGMNPGSVAKLEPKDLAKAFRELFKETNVTTNVGALSIPLESTLLTLIEIPKMSEAELQEAIPREALKYIPTKAEDVSLDWWVLPKQKASHKTNDKEVQDENIEVLIAAIHNSVLTKYNSIIDSVGLLNSSLEIEVFSAVRATQNRDMSAFMVFDMGATSTKLSMVERGVVKNSHIVNKGSQDITNAISQAKRVTVTKAEEFKQKIGLTDAGGDTAVSEAAAPVVDSILTEANQVLLNYQKKHRQPVTKVILIGGGVLLPGFEKRASEKLSTEVFYGDAFRRVETPVFLDSVLKEAGPEFAVALGLALHRIQDL